MGLFLNDISKNLSCGMSKSKFWTCVSVWVWHIYVGLSQYIWMTTELLFIISSVGCCFSDMKEMNSCFQTLSTRSKAELRGLFPRQQHQTSDDSMSECILQFSNVPRNCSVEAKTYLCSEWKMSQNKLYFCSPDTLNVNFISCKKGEKKIKHFSVT